MTNLRSDVGFVFFTNGTRYPLKVAQSDAPRDYVTFKNKNEQLRPRVVATGDNNILKLLWSAHTNTEPVLKWGTQPGVYTHVERANTQIFTPENFCGAPAATVGYRELGQLHTALFKGMNKLANKDIYYIFGDERTREFSAEQKLHVPPVPGTNPPTRPTTIILYDDLGRVGLRMFFVCLYQRLTRHYYRALWI
jgi:hypothetical protein